MKKLFCLTLVLILSLSVCLTAAADNVLRPGDRGNAVKNAQQALLNLGYYSGTVDGIYGVKTTNAVRLFQRVHGLIVDGKIGPDTNAVLTGNYARPNPGEAAPGSTVSASQVQQLLKKYGYYSGKITGKYDAATTAAIKEFQKANGLTVDGRVGDDTMAVLTGSEDALVKAPITSKNANAQDVREVQTLLQNYGYYTGKIDGIYGSGSIAAVRAFQAANGLKVDGAVGVKTLAKLRSGDVVTKGDYEDKNTLDSLPILRRGDSNESVKRAQRLLKAMGLYSGSIDGKYADQTIAAVSKFQEQNGLKVDGKVGPLTWAKLFNFSDDIVETPKEESTSKGDGVLRPGDKGDAVKALQEKLTRLGYSVTADGVYGDKTTAAVTRFQKDNNLKQDGKAGPATLTVLDMKLNQLALAN